MNSPNLRGSLMLLMKLRLRKGDLPTHSHAIKLVPGEAEMGSWVSVI